MAVAVAVAVAVAAVAVVVGMTTKPWLPCSEFHSQSSLSPLHKSYTRLLRHHHHNLHLLCTRTFPHRCSCEVETVVAA